MSRCRKPPTQTDGAAALFVLIVFLGMPTLMVVIGLLTNIPAVDAFIRGQP